MRKKTAKGTHYAKCAGLFPIKCSAHRFAIVFEKYNIPINDKGIYRIKIIRVTQEVDTQYCFRAFCYRRFQSL